MASNNLASGAIAAKSVTIWTIGHSNRSTAVFLGMLREHGINILVDVRRFPTSRIEHFKKNNMEQWLLNNGVEYLWLGRELGGYRKGGYRKHMQTMLFKEGVEILLEIAKSKRACIMCMEANPRHCHRRFICEHLETCGVEVIHILSRVK